MKGLHEIHVVIAELLHLDKEGQLWSALLTERQEHGTKALH